MPEITAYSAYKQDPDFQSKKAGAQLEVVLMDEDTGARIVGAMSGVNWNDDFEKVAVEEAGNPIVDEHTDGRHSGSGSMSTFMTPERLDNLPTSQDFEDKHFIVVVRKGPTWKHAGVVLVAFRGVKLNSQGGGFAARGNATLNLGMVYQRRYSPQEWATLSGKA